MKARRPAPSRRGFVCSDEGQALLEIALLAPVLVLLLIGIVEVGRFAHFNILASSAARAGVQYGQRNLITAADDAGMETAALSGGGNAPGLSVLASSYCTCADGSASSCSTSACSSTHRLVYVQTTSVLTFFPLFVYPGLPASSQITQTATMQVP